VEEEEVLAAAKTFKTETIWIWITPVKNGKKRVGPRRRGKKKATFR